ncbi:MAG: 2-hydroxyacid dehydrogenase [Fibrobacteres bacterium]|nr:2-hydroxyacid dehydrogenase [Fibrobacterota bacterium]
MKNKIAFFDAKPYDERSFINTNERFGFELKFFKPHLSADTVQLAAGYDAVCIFVNDTLSAPVIDTLLKGGVKIVALRCAGYNNVDLHHALNRLPVVRVPAYSPHAVAEHAFALLLTLNRKTHRAYTRTRDFNFTLNGLMGFDLYGKTIGVVGTGKIGREAVKIARGFGMKVLAFDSYADAQFAKETSCEYTTMERIFAESDVLTLHCPLTPETVHMVNEKSIAAMKKGVVIINTGRGKLIHTKSLIDGLKSGQIGGAGLDVYEEETDYFFEDFSGSMIEDDTLARLMTFPNVIITSHQAFFTEEAMSAIAETTLNNLKLFFAENKRPNEICYKCNIAPCPKETAQGRCF